MGYLSAPRRPSAFHAAAWLFFLACAGSLAAQEPAEPSGAAEPARAEDFLEMMDVEIVNIDVWVTDRDGAPVHGLGRDDFEILRDGRPVATTNFYAVANGRPESEAASTSAAAEPAGEGGSVRLELPDRSPTLAPEHRLWLVVFIDNYNIDPLERKRVMPAVRTFLGSTLREGDRAMVVTYDRGLEVKQPFTDNLPVLQAALDEVEEESGLAVIRRRERIEVLKRIDDEGNPTRALLFARQYAEEQMNAVEYTVSALQELVESLGGLPGRKALVHVSSGIPMQAGEELFHVIATRFNVSEVYGEIPRHSTTRSFERVNRHANAHRVVFHTLDAGGLRAMDFGSAEFEGFKNPHVRRTLDSVVPENLQSSLRLMALETGGRVIVNRNEVLPALIEVGRDFRSFYSLGISSATESSGRFHEIEVRLKEGARDRGYRVRHRSGYRSKTADTRMREKLRSALLYAHQSNPLGVEVEWGEAEPGEGRDTYEIPLQLRIPLQDLVLLPLGEKHELRLRLYAGVVGEEGQASEIEGQNLGLRLAPEHVEAARGEAMIHNHRILVSRGRQKIGLTLFDVFGREASTITRYVTVGPRDS
ncbi:MAG: VWA domain-containing protein [Acidobacteriota bacterium]